MTPFIGLQLTKRVRYCPLIAVVICKAFGVQLTWISRARAGAVAAVTVHQAVTIPNGCRWQGPRPRIVFRDSWTARRKRRRRIMPIFDRQRWRSFLMRKWLVPFRFTSKLPRPFSTSADVDTVSKGANILLSLCIRLNYVREWRSYTNFKYLNRIL